jgi:hypothetical protein
MYKGYSQYILSHPKPRIIVSALEATRIIHRCLKLEFTGMGPATGPGTRDKSESWISLTPTDIF